MKISFRGIHWQSKEILFTVHEISSVYYMKVPENFEPVCDRFTEDGNKGWLIVFRGMYLR